MQHKIVQSFRLTDQNIRNYMSTKHVLLFVFFAYIVKHDRNLVQGCGKFKVYKENPSLEFAVHSISWYINISVNALKRHRNNMDF